MNRRFVLRGTALLSIVALPLIVGVLIAHRAVDLPFWDEWETADLVYKMHVGTLQVSDIWAQHNEHRIFFPTLITLGLAALGGWDPVREQFLSLAFLVVCQIAIVALIRRVAHGAIGTYAAFTASLFLYGIWQYENLGWGFQLAWFMCNASAIAAALLLTHPGRRADLVALAVLCAVAGSYSSSQGLVVWAVGAVAIVLHRRDAGVRLALWLPAGALTYAWYRHGLASLDAGHVNVAAQPITVARYIFAYLGSPLGGWLGSNGSALIGLAVVAALGAFFVADYRSPFRKRRLVRNAPWYAVAVYPLLCAAGTSTGRAGFGIDQALSSRYTTISLLAWVAIVALAAGAAARAPRDVIARSTELVVVTAVAFVVLAGASDLTAWKYWTVNARTLVTARADLVHNDPAGLQLIYPARERVVMLMRELKSIHENIYAAP